MQPKPSSFRGHKIEVHSEVFVYSDTLEPVSRNPNRSCGHCGLANRSDGHDACLRELPGVANACCGHGVQDESYIVFENGVRISGFLPPHAGDKELPVRKL